MPSVTLYQMPQVVTLSESAAVSVSNVINRTDFNLFKHVANQVEFLFKTVDRKPVSFATLPAIYIVDDATNQLIVQQTLTAVDIPRGHYRLLLDPNKAAALEPGYYRYSITHQDINGNQFLVYTDQNRSMRGFLEVFEGPLPTPQQAMEINGNEFQATLHGLPLETYFMAPTSYPGAAQRNNRSGLHTLALYTENWSGTFYVEASLENGAPTAQSDWFPVTEVTMTEQTGVRSIQFTGNYMWLRVFYKPADPSTGTITKALLKN